MKFKKICTALTAGFLCVTILGACGSAGQTDNSKSSETAEQSNTAQQSDAEDQSDNTDNAENAALPEEDLKLPEGTSDQPSEESDAANAGTFTTQDINGETYTQELFQDYDLTMVNVFATWCSPCVNEIPDLEKLHVEMAEKGVNVVGIVMDAVDYSGNPDPEAIEKAIILAEQTGATYPFLLPDSTKLNGRLNNIDAFPETFFIDREGNIVGHSYIGSASLEDWRETVLQELENLKGAES